MTTDPYYFPFKIIDKDSLIPGENYYIKLNDRVVRDFLSKHRNLPVSHLQGTFEGLHIENKNNLIVEYAVFKNIRILNHKYKIGLCNQMMIRYPEGFLANTDCDTYSDLNRTINPDRDVFLNLKKWIFGQPTEIALITKQAIKKIEPNLNEDVLGEINRFRGTIKGGKSKSKKTRRRKNKIYKRRKTYKR